MESRLSFSPRLAVLVASLSLGVILGGAGPGPVAGLTEAEEAKVGRSYLREVHQCLKNHWDPTDITTGDIRGLSASVWVRISSSGKLSDYRVERSSDVSAFDRAVEKAIRRCDQVSRPPREIRKRILQYGIEIEFRPAD
jgi:TonB family protein